MIGHRMNGFTIVAVVTDLHRPEEAIILGVRREGVTGRPAEYVTGRVYVPGRVLPEADLPTQWHAGHYFSTSARAPREAQMVAHQDLLQRAGVALFDAAA